MANYSQMILKKLDKLEDKIDTHSELINKAVGAISLAKWLFPPIVLVSIASLALSIMK